MEAEEVCIEEGEISDDGVSNYTPLERPSNYSAVAQPNARFPTIIDSESENELIQSSEDSDSDLEASKRTKKPKIKLRPKRQLECKSKQEKKYDIWSTRVQEDVLAETLNSCDVTKKDRSRDVESYDYLNHFWDNEEDEKPKLKRNRDEMKNPNYKIKKQHKSKDKEQKGCSRHILDLAVNSDNSAEEIAKDIANKLCEEKEDLILKVIEAMGKEKAFEIFKETKRIEEEGGMLIMNQTRRRTPGGVFLFLIRHDSDITLEQKSQIFEEEKQKYKIQQRMKQKKRYEKLKAEIAKSRDKLLPDLITRAELLANENNRTRKETDVSDVINPPPTPETDHHENSGDGMDGSNVFNSDRKIEAYDEDFLDIGLNNTDMELF